MKKLMALLMVLLMTLSASALAATIETTGTASVSLSPDTAQLSLGIRSVMTDVNKAMSDVNKRVDSISKALNKLNVAKEDMVAASVYIYSNYDYETKANTDYNVSRQMQITCRDITTVGEIIDAALEAGADEINDVSFTSSLQRDAYDEALAKAVADAKKRAMIIAGAENLTLGSLSSLKENETWTGNAFSYGDGDAGVTSTQIDVGSMNVQASVTAVYEAE